MQRRLHLKILKIIPFIAAGTALFAATGLPAQASSHREAPFITEQPKVDGTDWYMFQSYETGRSGFTTLIANYQPFQDAYGGPNYFFMDPDALYEIHIDNNADANEDLTFQFRFQNTLQDLQVDTGGGVMVSVPLINIGPFGPAITAGNPLNIVETYTVRAVRGDRRTGFSSSGLAKNSTDNTTTTFNKPADNIGNKSIPDYPGYATNHVFNINIPGCTTDVATQGRVFVGQRKEPFYINVGEIFDLINLNPLGARNSEPNTLFDKNVTTLALEVPTSCLTANGDGSGIIGGWQTASLRQGRLLNPSPGSDSSSATREGGAYVQVSRLSMPLVNEVVIGVKDKNKFNASRPRNDGTNFLTYVTNPTLPVLVNVLFNVPPPAVPRNDLVQVFLTGVANVNQPPGLQTPLPAGATQGTPSEMMRLNTGLPVSPAATQNDLGALQCFVNGTLTLGNPGCDPAGFPNGRRPIDDVVDITLRAAEGVLIPGHNAAADTVNDGAQLVGAAGGAGASTDFGVAFPYLNAPIPGSPNGPNGVTP
ncbi:MAG: DUF4331 domain-containing protein [Gammaproteobacteria bacterium]